MSTNLTTPQPIETAPKDGTVVLTDCGPARYLDQKRWGSPVPHGKWALSYVDGNLISDSDEGIETCGPKFWVSMPEWMTG